MIVKDVANIKILHVNKHQAKCNVMYNTKKKKKNIITLITLFIVTLYNKSN